MANEKEYAITQIKQFSKYKKAYVETSLTPIENRNGFYLRNVDVSIIKLIENGIYTFKNKKNQEKYQSLCDVETWYDDRGKQIKTTKSVRIPKRIQLLFYFIKRRYSIVFSFFDFQHFSNFILIIILMHNKKCLFANWCNLQKLLQ